MSDLGDLVPTVDACRILDGIHPSTISRWVQLGRLTPAARVGNGLMLFRRADVEALRDALREARAAEQAPDDEPNGVAV